MRRIESKSRNNKNSGGVSFFKSLKFRLVGSTMCAALLLSLLLVRVLIYEYNLRVEREYEARAISVSKMIAAVTNPDDIDRYLNTLEKDDTYHHYMRNMRFMQQEFGLLFVHITRPTVEGLIFAFDTDITETAYDLGELMPWHDILETPAELEENADFIQTLASGGEVAPIIANSPWGRLLTVYEPIYRADGSVAAYAGVDISVEQILAQRGESVLLYGGIGFSLLLITTAFSYVIAKSYVIAPIESLIKRTKSFRADGGAEGFNPVPELKIACELAVLEHALIETEQRVVSEARRRREAEEAFREENSKHTYILENILNAMDAFICVTVPETGELLFLSDSLRKIYKITGSLSGLYCFKELQNMEARCPYCPYYQLEENPDEVIIWEQQDPASGRIIRKTALLIDWPGGLKGHLEYGVDVTDIREADVEIERRDILLSAVNRAANALLSARDDIPFDTKLMTGMEIIGECANADCVEIWQNEENYGEHIAVLRYCWSRLDELKNDGNSGDKTFEYSQTDNWYERMSRGEYIHGELSALAEKDREYFMGSGIKSMLTIPLFADGRFWGVCCIDNYAKPNVKSEDEIEILRSGSLMLAGALNSYEAMQRMLKSKAKQQQLRAEKEIAEAASEIKSQFLANVSHEIRTPMNAVIGMTEILLAEELTDTQRSCALDIKFSATALLSLINDILDISKIQAGKLTVSPVHYDFPQFLDNISSMTRLLAQNKDIAYEYRELGEIPPYIYGDDTRLRQALLNVLGNAVKFTDKGGVKFTVDASTDKLVFIISDTGIGIKPEDADMLFDPFTQADTAKNRAKVGTGLGLSITKSIIEIMDGEITFESEYGKGTVFMISVPKIIGDKSQIAAQGEAKPIYAPNAKVLVVDDNAININVAKGLLRLCKITPDAASSGYEAIEMIKQKEYDIVFMDHMMPGMDGTEASRIIRRAGGKFPIIALTANAGGDMRDVFAEAGMNDVVTKPIDKEKFFGALSAWLPAHLSEGAPAAPIYEEDERRPDGGGETFLQALSAIDGLDAQKGIEYSGGGHDTYTESLRLMLNEADMTPNKLNKLLSGGDIHGFEVAVHALKSCLANIGAQELSEDAQELERAAERLDINECAAKLPRFLDKLERLRDGIKKTPILKDAGAEAAELPDGLAPVLKELKAALEQTDFAETDKAVNNLKEFDISGYIKSELLYIEEAVLMMDYESAEHIIQRLLGEER